MYSPLLPAYREYPWCLFLPAAPGTSMDNSRQYGHFMSSALNIVVSKHLLPTHHLRQSGALDTGQHLPRLPSRSPTWHHELTPHLQWQGHGGFPPLQRGRGRIMGPPCPSQSNIRGTFPFDSTPSGSPPSEAVLTMGDVYLSSPDVCASGRCSRPAVLFPYCCTESSTGFPFRSVCWK